MNGNKNNVVNAVYASILIIAMLAFTLSGCSNGKTGNGLSADDYEGKPFSNSFDMAVVHNGVTYPVRVDSSNVLDALGNEYEYSDCISCVYEGYDKTFEYEGITISTVPIDGVDIIEMFTITGSGYTTPRNIGVGDTRDDIIAAYGENYFDDGYLTYTESNDQANITEMRIQFELLDDVIQTIYIYSPSYSA